MSRKSPKKTRNQKSRGLEVDIDAVKILRTVNNEEAFYFYEAIGKPTGECARSLSDFLKSVESVKTESLLFHLQRKDFQNWIEKTIGDPELAKRIGKTIRSRNDDIKTRIRSILEERIRELSETSALTVEADLTLASQCITS